MAVIRVNKTNDFTVMSNAHFKEKNMSLKAKGLLSLMLSLPDDWDYSVAGLTELSADGKDSVMNALAELERFGYLKRTRSTDQKGRFAGYDYDVYEQPQSDIPYSGKPYAENPNTDKPYTENPQQLNTNISNTKEINISSDSDDDSDDPDGQLSLTESRVITLSVKEAAEEIYKPYPRKEGKAKGFEEIQAYLKKGRNLSGLGTVRFNHEQLYCAVRDYAMDCSEKNTERQYIQLFSTFMNKTVPDYVEKSAGGYEKYMERKYGNDWRNIEFVYK